MSATNRIYGLGRRKSAVAQVILTATPAERQVNGRDFADYFPTTATQNAVLKPLVTASKIDEHGFTLKVHGGGVIAQAQAASLAIARALVGQDEDYRKQLKKSGLLSRDPREKERKKPGLKRARRAPQFSKR